jgi:hypothetical protein
MQAHDGVSFMTDKSNSNIPDAVRHFSILPDDALAPFESALYLFPIKSRQTVYDWIEQKILPATVRVGSRNAFRVGDLRAALKKLAEVA